jgi:hypothetical protein
MKREQQIVVNLLMGRNSQRAPVTTDRLLQSPLLAQRPAQVDVKRPIFGMTAQCLATYPNHFIEIPDTAERAAQQADRRHVIGTKRQRSPACFNRLFGSAGGEQWRGELSMGFGEIRTKDQYLAKRADRLIESSLMIQDDAERQPQDRWESIGWQCRSMRAIRHFDPCDKALRPNRKLHQHDLPAT